jgi:hypothetical protein
MRMTITISEKEMVVHVKHYFDKEQELYSKTNEFPLVTNPARRTALATDLSEVTVWRIMVEYNRNHTLSPPFPKGSSPYAVDDHIKAICQDIIRSYNIRREHLSLRLLVGILNDTYGITVARETLRRCLYRWKILPGSVQRPTALRERDYVVKARRDYLIKKRLLNESGRMLVLYQSLIDEQNRFQFIDLY